MPTRSKKKIGFWARQKKRYDDLLKRRPHRSFRLTRRRDYLRPLALPGYFSFAFEVTRMLWRNRKTFILLGLIYIVFYAVLVGVQSQDTYTALSDTLQSANQGETVNAWDTVQNAGLVLAAAISANASTGVTEAQQIFSVLIFILVWLTTVWLLRSILAGHKVKLRDGLYNSGAPLFATMIVAGIIVIQLLPAAIAAIGYQAAASSGLLESGAPAMLFWIGAALLVILSLFWITSSLFAMVIVTVPGVYPYKAIRTAGDIVLGRRIKILLRWLFMAVTIIVAWLVILIPIILFDMWLKSVWTAAEGAPIVPIAFLIVSAFSVIWAAAYVYLLYRKVVDYVPE